MDLNLVVIQQNKNAWDLLNIQFQKEIQKIPKKKVNKDNM